jgi:ubiquinone/menaquinone biosynthesis C-methylase UbiE
MLSHDEARAFYDRFGSKQDWQRFYEEPAIIELIRHGSFAEARAVVEFGCGTGRLAELLLRNHLPDTTTYLALDVSSTMVSLSRDRLARFGSRVRVAQTAGSPRLGEPSESCDRFISTYVLDLLAADDITTLIAEAHRLLSCSGRIGFVGLTHGATPAARLVERLWVAVHRVRPSWVGGCRPVSLGEFVGSEWQVTHQAVVTSFAISSEVVVAQKVPQAAAQDARAAAES